MESQFLFVSENPHNQASQLIWTVFAQGLRDRPHLLGQLLSQALACFEFSLVAILQHIDDIYYYVLPQESSLAKTPGS